jgi:hypothetical protein
MQPELIGYFPKKVVGRPDWLKADRVTAIRSVSDCVSKGPDGWIQHWTHNEMYVYSTIGAAMALIPKADLENYELHAYRILPLKWDDGKEIPVIFPVMNIEPLPMAFQSVGFDVVSIEDGVAGFGHSPLSCNRMAQEIKTNADCLLDDISIARRCALDFSVGDVEPGPYYVVEVLRRSAMG